jgi:hypothetical protein
MQHIFKRVCQIIVSISHRWQTAVLECCTQPVNYSDKAHKAAPTHPMQYK